MNVEFFEKAYDVVLEIEVNPNGASRFAEKYHSITGDTPKIGNAYQRQPNKWGLECRVYFNCDSDMSDEFTSIDVYVEEGSRAYRGQQKYRTNDREFFWSLVESGYRLGKN